MKSKKTNINCFQNTPLVENGHILTPPLFPYSMKNKGIRGKNRMAVSLLRELLKIRVL